MINPGDQCMQRFQYSAQMQCPIFQANCILYAFSANSGQCDRCFFKPGTGLSPAHLIVAIQTRDMIELFYVNHTSVNSSDSYNMSSLAAKLSIIHTSHKCFFCDKKSVLCNCVTIVLQRSKHFFYGMQIKEAQLTINGIARRNSNLYATAMFILRTG